MTREQRQDRGPNHVAIRVILAAMGMLMGWPGTEALGVERIGPSSTLTPKNIRPLPVNASWDYPWVVSISASGAASAQGHDRGMYVGLYNPQPGAWGGGGFSYDNDTTPAIETGDLSQLSQLTIGMVQSAGTAPTHVKFELVDDQNRKGFVHLVGISTTEQVWAVPTAKFQAQGVSLARIRTIYFIVETLASFQSFSGFKFMTFPPGSHISYLATALPLEPQEPNYLVPSAEVLNRITIMPGNPIKTHVAPPGADAGGPGTPRGAIFHYATGTPGWAGVGWTFDNFETPSIETQDLTRYRLAVGIKGDAPAVKCEIIDYLDRKAIGYLRGIERGTEKVWEIYTTSDVTLYGVDPSRIRIIYFIVEGANRTGTLEVNNRPTPLVKGASSLVFSPSDINLPGNPRNVPIVPVGATASILPTSRGMQLQCQTGRARWVGGGFHYDNPATPTVETGDFSYRGLSTPLYWFFGLQGTMTGGSLKVEFVDEQERKAAYKLVSPGQAVPVRPDREQVWAVNGEWVRYHYGLNMGRIKVVYFIVEGANVQSNITINRRLP